MLGAGEITGKPRKPSASRCLWRICRRRNSESGSALNDALLLLGLIWDMIDRPAQRRSPFHGPNGAGKSTLIKLMCRLYDPDEGRIELDAADIRAFGLEDLRRLISVLFQVPVHYNATVRDNICLGDLTAVPRSDEIEAAARASGAEDLIARLPQGHENMLGRWFEGGSELSVGEWQRIALARTFLRRAPILILDEPTSAMDSWTEADWMARMRRFAEGRTTIIITHRLTTACLSGIPGTLRPWRTAAFRSN